jgi:hypothetical protein
MLDKYFIGWRKCKREATTSSFVLMICLDAPSNSSSTVDLGCCFGNLQLLGKPKSTLAGNMAFGSAYKA